MTLYTCTLVHLYTCILVQWHILNFASWIVTFQRAQMNIAEGWNAELAETPVHLNLRF